MKKLIMPFVFFPLFFALSCRSSYLKGYDDIHGKSFVLQRVFFYQKGANSELILHQMKEAELPKLMRLLEHRYDIGVDTGEYDLFLLAGDSSRIKASGLLSYTDFLWEGSAAENRIEFECRHQETANGMDTDKEFRLNIYADGKRAAVIYGTFTGASVSLPEAAAAAGYQKAKDVSGDVYTDTLSGQSIALEKDENSELAAEKLYVQRTQELKAKIREHIHSLPPSYRERCKREIAEYLNAGK